ncbi:nitrite reductase small subunit NirD [Arthrobacter sp.]|uniref:nitrite reductase small subunit NirD n=1 Tax=Arthrobacter sp. TaxID=1667 RepID=UPI003A8DEBA3
MTALTTSELHGDAFDFGPLSDLASGDIHTAPTGVQWHRVCSADDLEQAWGEAALIGDRQLALFRLSATEFHAVDQSDPATGAHVMSRGIVGTRGVLRTIASPLHKEVYVLDTGECLTNPDLVLPTYPVRVEGGHLAVGIPAARQMEAA